VFLSARFPLGLLVDPEDGGDMLLQNVGPFSNCTTLQPRRELLKIKTHLGETGRKGVTGFIWLRIGISGGHSYVGQYPGYPYVVSDDTITNACGTVGRREFCFYLREHGNEFLDSIKAMLILGQLSDY
jgi:hypothetical protein